MKRVLINMPSQHAKKYSGVSKMIFSLLEQLIQNDDFAYVLRSSWRKSDLPRALQSPRLEVITIARPKILILSVLLEMFSMPLFCRRHKIDYLLNADPYGAPLGAKARAVIVHDLYFRTLAGQTPLRGRLTSELIFRLMLWGNRRVVSVSNATKLELQRAFPRSRARIEVIHSAPTLRDGGGAPGRAPVAVPARYVLIVGNATYNKNFPVVPQAMARQPAALADVSLVHVGHDDGDLLAALSPEEKQRFSLTRLKGLTDDELSAVYGQALCLCVPSLAEGFCLPILEAQLCGCPVLCADVSAMPEIAGNAAILFDPHDVEDLSGKLARLAGDPDLRARLVAAGYENARQYSWDRAAARYEDVFRMDGSAR
ncbi:Glycosyltransferase involved in cell wall bisynthesis [Methylobacterium phyllostachyos]|uniref:Glycosyltransferase involved in cell wall bisynthesis n=1 Tax=Methylobacterium phyllostachyos TaxID=582672 RepID=A0A1H0I5M9_9HYPH|nr:glycosyltransferase family 1 protein [Methylobacterium phyllostachyos]SDO26722.1 Glycosyltransferase involved in cell wall bisynthesis [Methylobacterium phyllostachyos]